MGDAGGESRMGHISVLMDVVLHWLRVRPGGVYIDCTVGEGGHSAAIAQRLEGGRLIALDRDPAAVEAARQRLADLQSQFDAEVAAVAARVDRTSIETVTVRPRKSDLSVEEVVLLWMP